MDRYSIARSPAELDLISQISVPGKPFIVIKWVVSEMKLRFSPPATSQLSCGQDIPAKMVDQQFLIS